MTALRRLGRTGVRVSPLTLGTMNLGAWGNPDHAEGVQIIHAALDAGINVIDTADVYAQGESEEIVGKALQSPPTRRDNVILATKFHAPIGDEPNHQGNSRRWITQAVEDSLRRLRTDYIDLYQVHRPEPGTDLDETIGALSDLVRAGKIRYFGTSTFSGAELVESQWVAERRGYVRPVTEQPPYSLLVRGIEREVLPVAERYGIGVIPWSPLAGGWLSGRFDAAGRPVVAELRKERAPGRFDPAHAANEAKVRAAQAFGELARDAGIPLPHLALAFVLEHPAISSAIIGPRTLEQLGSQLDTADLRLSQDILDRIDEIVPPGTNVNALDAGYLPPALAEPAQRRRSHGNRSAGTADRFATVAAND
ncbi:MAG: aldo/keto reductase [Patulibacter sp.]